MPLTDQDIRDIAARATPLFERMERSLEPISAIGNDRVIDQRVKKWTAAISRGDAERFQKRLAWDNLDEDRVRLYLGGVRWPEDSSLPGWTDTLRAVSEVAATLTPDIIKTRAEEVWRFLNSNRVIMFEELLVPFVDLGRQRLRTRTGDRYQRLTVEAQALRERDLMIELIRISSQTFYLEFSVFRMQSGRDVALERRLGKTPDKSSNVLYNSFVTRLLDDGLSSFFKEYVVLARLLSTAVEFWVDSTAECVERLDEDLSLIIESFFSGETPGQVVDMRSSLSDAHHNGRSVVILTFDNQSKLVYKPKNLGLEEAYIRLIQWLNDHGAPYQLRPIKVHHRGDYGWIEYVTPEPCRNTEDINRYYGRAGALMCILYALQSTDMHMENLIACKDQPILVDMETVLYPDIITDANEETAWEQANTILRHSVLYSGLLPRWKIGFDDQVIDQSPLGYEENQDIGYISRSWEGINTDELSIEFNEARTTKGQNAPSIQGNQVTFQGHQSDIIAGFEATHRFLNEQKPILMESDGPLQAFQKQTVRFINRNTELYATLLKKVLDPVYLRDGADRSIELDRLSRRYVVFKKKPLFWPILASERQQMEVMDVPYFKVNADSVDLQCPGSSSIVSCFQQSAYQHVVSCLDAFDKDDLDRQRTIIRAAFGARTAVEDGISVQTETEEVSDIVNPMTPAEKIETALKYAEDLRRWSIRGPDGSLAWIGLDFAAGSQRHQLKVLGNNMYSGMLGISFFLSALENVTGGAGFRDLAMGGLSLLRHRLQLSREKQETFKWWGMGVGSGMGAAIYALTHIGQFLDAPELIEEARYMVTLISPDHIDRGCDVLSGTAGGILGLATLYQAAPEDRIIDLVATCAHHLLANRIMTSTGYRAWQFKDQKGTALTGLSHGAAGVAYALIRAYNLTGDKTILEAAQEAIAFENSVYNNEEQNWPDFRKLEDSEAPWPGFLSQWCHGATGIGHARLAALPLAGDLFNESELYHDIDRAIDTTQRFLNTGLDHTCCGIFGRLSFLADAGRRLDRDELIESAELAAARVLKRAATAGCFRLPIMTSNNAHHPGLFRGVSGIGYELLRLAEPDVLPSVLVWE